MTSSSSAPFMTEILEFLRRVGTERSTARLIGEMFRFVGDTFDVHRVSLFLSGDDGALAPFVSEPASGDRSPELFEEWRRLDVESFDVVRWIRRGRDAVVVDDPMQAGIPADVVRRYELQPYVAVPLRREEELLGILIVEGEIAVLRGRSAQIGDFADFLAMMLANALAFEQEQQRAREAEALLEVGRALTETNELIPVLASVAQNCARVTGFDRCSVFLVDEDTGCLRPTMSQFADGHIDEEAWKKFMSARDEIPAARHVLRTGEPLAFDDPHAAPDMCPPWWVDLFNIRLVLFLPLTAWGRRFGVLALDRDRYRRINEQQITVARGVAAQGAVAIEMSRLLARERAAVVRLEELDDLKTTFMATVSHELRTPLTTIIGFGDILEQHVDGSEAAEYLALIQRESAHLESLIANLLLTSNIEAGGLQLRRERADLAEVVHEAAEIIGRVHPDRDFAVDAPGPLVVEGADPARLRQVFTNLLQNAAKYSPRGTPVGVTATHSGPAIEVAVTDRGPGIPAEMHETVFERFQRGPDQGVQGTGIGLYLVRELVRAHGGRVWIEPGPDDAGTSFVVAIPAGVERASAA